MYTEYEATFTNINKDEIRGKFKKAGAKLVKPEFIQKRVVFYPPNQRENENIWLRVRDEGDKITMSIKTINGNRIDDQKEICLEVNDFDEAVALLKSIGCKQKAYQVTKRELWMLDNVELAIDEWPYLEPFVEVEGKSEEDAKKVCKKIGFDYSKAYFGAVDGLYEKKYNISKDKIDNHTPRITFEDENPFV